MSADKSWYFMLKSNVVEFLQGHDLLNVAIADSTMLNLLAPIISRHVTFRHPGKKYEFIFYTPLKLRVGGHYGHLCHPPTVNCQFEFSVMDIPSNLTQLILGDNFEFPLEEHLRKFNSLTHLTFERSYLRNINYLPQSLTHLKFKGPPRVRDIYKIFFLPPKLVYLEVRGGYYHLETVLPSTLEVFICTARRFMVSTIQNPLPNLKEYHTTTLNFWTHPIIDLTSISLSPLPSKLLKLTIRYGKWETINQNLLELICYATNFENGSLPPSLTHLTLNDCVVPPRMWDIIFSLPNLTYLKLMGAPSKPLDYKVVSLPPKLMTLIVEGEWYPTIFAQYSRPSISSFTLNGSDANNLQFTDITGYFHQNEWNSHTLSLLQSLDVSSEVLEQLPPNLKSLHVRGSYFPLPPLPNSLETLKISHKDYNHALPVLPSSLKYLSNRSSFTHSIPTLPSGLISLSLGDSSLTVIYPQLPPLPRSLRVLELNFQLGEHTITEFPPFLTRLVITSYKYPLPPLPLTLEDIYISPNLKSICHLK